MRLQPVENIGIALLTLVTARFPESSESSYNNVRPSVRAQRVGIGGRRGQDLRNPKFVCLYREPLRCGDVRNDHDAVHSPFPGGAATLNWSRRGISPFDEQHLDLRPRRAAIRQLASDSRMSVKLPNRLRGQILFDSHFRKYDQSYPLDALSITSPVPAMIPPFTVRCYHHKPAVARIRSRHAAAMHRLRIEGMTPARRSPKHGPQNPSSCAPPRVETHNNGHGITIPNAAIDTTHIAPSPACSRGRFAMRRAMKKARFTAALFYRKFVQSNI